MLNIHQSNSGMNGPCPCNSGRKYEYCHWPEVQHIFEAHISPGGCSLTDCSMRVRIRFCVPVHRLLPDHRDGQRPSQKSQKAAPSASSCSAPCSDATDTVVVGVNHDILSAQHKILSNASCTTNCLAPMTRAVDMSFPVKAG